MQLSIIIVIYRILSIVKLTKWKILILSINYNVMYVRKDILIKIQSNVSYVKKFIKIVNNAIKKDNAFNVEKIISQQN